MFTANHPLVKGVISLGPRLFFPVRVWGSKGSSLPHIHIADCSCVEKFLRSFCARGPGFSIIYNAKVL